MSSTAPSHSASAPEAPSMRLSEIPPRTELAAYVGTYFYLRFTPSMQRERRIIVMASPSVDLLFNLGDPFYFETFGDSVPVQRGITLHGPRPATTFLRREGELCFLGVRFKHGAAATFLPYPVKELTQKFVPLDQVWPEHAKGLLEGVRTAASPAEQVKRVEAMLVKALAKARKPDPQIRRAVRLIAQHQGDLEVSALAAELGVSRQTVKHKFDQTVGLSPKLFGKLRRFHTVLRRLAAQPGVEWTKLAQECGYYDQAHLIREFNHFTGFSPQKFLKNLGRGEDLYMFDSADQTHYHMADRFKELAGV